MKDANKTLKDLENMSGYSISYLDEQWNWQQQLQLQAMENKSEHEMKKQVEELVHLEDKLRETQSESFFSHNNTGSTALTSIFLFFT